MLANRMFMASAGSAITADGNDEYTKLLMHMEGTDDAQVFTDSSVGNLVKVGNSIVGTGYGVFDGTGDSLTLVDSTDFDYTGNFTIEFWLNPTIVSRNEAYLSTGAYAADHLVIYRSTTVLKIYYDGTIYVTTHTLKANVWQHIAFVRNGNTLDLYADGVEKGSFDVTGDEVNHHAQIIGSDSGNSMHGQLDELRISDVARYTTGWTPERTKFTSDANTMLLLHMDLPNTDPTVFVDSGNSTHTVTTVGNTYQAQDDVGIIGTSCGYFDGTGDYLSCADSADWELGNTFAIEMWVRLTSIAASQMFTCQNEGAPNNAQCVFYFDSTLGLRFQNYTAAVVDIDANQGNTTGWAVNTWYHIAATSDGTNYRIFKDGVILATVNSAAVVPDLASVLEIGRRVSYNDLLFAGYLEELRISHVARYTANFTPQITPFTSDANTKLLLHFDGGEGSVAFTDSGNTGHTVTAAGNAIQVIGHGATAAGNVKTENTQKKFGTTAAYFDGTGDYITLPDSLDYSFGTEPWTIDMWVNFSSIAAHSGLFEQYADANNLIIFYRNTNTNTQFWAVVGGVYKAGYYWAWTPSLDTWYHMAIVRNGTDFSIYVDGVAQSLTVANAIGTNAMPDVAAPMIIGKTVFAPALMNGDIDELRISKGIARWTANFTPPTKAYS